MLSCLHTHTSLCDGKGSIADYCAAAYEKGFVSLGFSAHAPLLPALGIKTNWHLPHEHIERYCDEVNEAKITWRGRLEIYLGMEVDYIDGITGPAGAFYQNLNLDYIIGSVHCVVPTGKSLDWAMKFGKELVCIDGSEDDFRLLLEYGFDGSARALVEAYYQAECAMCRAGGFKILGHADLIMKNNQSLQYFNPHEEYYAHCVEQIADAAASANIVVEVNTGGLNRGKTHDVYPSDNILTALYKRSVPLTINADAHCPAHLDGHYDAARAVIFAAGYAEYYVFARNAWQRVNIQCRDAREHRGQTDV